MNSQHIKVTHEIDAQKRRAYARAEIKFDLTETAIILDSGPIRLELPNATFRAFMKVSGSADGSQSREATASVTGDWRLVLGGQPIITLREAQLLFNDSGGLQYKIDPANIELPDVLKFVTDKLASFFDSTSGLSSGSVPGGFRCLLDLTRA